MEWSEEGVGAARLRLDSEGTPGSMRVGEKTSGKREWKRRNGQMVVRKWNRWRVI